jgi:hypothetical protein
MKRGLPRRSTEKNESHDDTHALSNPHMYPTPEVIEVHLRKAYVAYNAVLKLLREQVPGSKIHWRYYNDGKQWLMRASDKTSTLFWCSIGKESFRTSFYMSGEAESTILGSTLPEDSKQAYRATRGKKFRGITVRIRNKKDMSAFKELLNIKTSRTKRAARD